ncbi:protein lurp-one-related 17 [Phtheirospermum japonicum]|uniref:Protein lurp-one-related 17 n=1 Tax=Phtheirospermum japonicum TaxID=374723 RepID=A0A830C0H4_9LAMI|nr:protein lurp-one-related 17 [Phtheirospermum japonicum]
MILFLKSRSRTVHHYEEEEKEYKNEESCISLTVWRKSLLLSCKGFTVIGSDGNLVYRVDNYTLRPDRIILMDGSGKPIFTICRRKKLKVVAENNWLVYEGEVGKKNMDSSKKPMFSVRKNISIMKTKPSVVAYVYGGVSEKGYDYVIEGSYEHRSCKILDGSRRVVSEIKKKEALSNGGGVSFGLEVFDLIVNPGIDSRFAMAIVLLLDQMFS